MSFFLPYIPSLTPFIHKKASQELLDFILLQRLVMNIFPFYIPMEMKQYRSTKISEEKKGKEIKLKRRESRGKIPPSRNETWLLQL